MQTLATSDCPPERVLPEAPCPTCETVMRLFASGAH